MSFYKVVSDEEVSGTEVKLTDTLMMILQLDEQWTGEAIVCESISISYPHSSINLSCPH